ncbi:hypothetical protein QO058_14315 [Bosea vestrisii]|uniref:hypothetical protein n=1 Tax=Bosea vestrisii TaxID=151416 RepID=UPI0024E01798|nr:hypothetical protein [Bosea vestrisii]WID99306.1 hypothetical protein QO058_14315 [Bosea vestrisii]
MLRRFGMQFKMDGLAPRRLSRAIGEAEFGATQFSSIIGSSARRSSGRFGNRIAVRWRSRKAYRQYGFLRMRPRDFHSKIPIPSVEKAEIEGPDYACRAIASGSPKRSIERSKSSSPNVAAAMTIMTCKRS